MRRRLYLAVAVAQHVVAVGGHQHVYRLQHDLRMGGAWGRGGRMFGWRARWGRRTAPWRALVTGIWFVCARAAARHGARRACMRRRPAVARVRAHPPLTCSWVERCDSRRCPGSSWGVPGGTATITPWSSSCAKRRLSPGCASTSSGAGGVGAAAPPGPGVPARCRRPSSSVMTGWYKRFNTVAFTRGRAPGVGAMVDAEQHSVHGAHRRAGARSPRAAVRAAQLFQRHISPFHACESAHTP